MEYWLYHKLYCLQSIYAVTQESSCVCISDVHELQCNNQGTEFVQSIDQSSYLGFIVLGGVRFKAIASKIANSVWCA